LYAIDYAPFVIDLTETWLSDDDKFLISLPNYTFISLPRKSIRGGGVFFVALNSFVYVIKKPVVYPFPMIYN